MSSFISSLETFNSSSTAYEASNIASKSPALLCGITVYNSSASTQYIQFHDAVSLPADTTAPKYFFDIQATSTRTLDYGINPRKFSTGIVVCNSSTPNTKTIGSADCWFDVQMKKAI